MSPVGSYGSMSTGCEHGCRGYQFNMEYHHAEGCPLKAHADRMRKAREDEQTRKEKEDEERRRHSAYWWGDPHA